MSNRIESSVPIPPLEKIPPIHPNGLPIDSKLTIQELSQTQKYVHSREPIVYQQQVALDILPNTPEYTRISTEDYPSTLTNNDVAFIERDTSTIVERFTLLDLEYLDQELSNTTTPHAMTRYDVSGNPFMVNTIPPKQGVREEGYFIRVFSVAKSSSISLTDISNALLESTFDDVSLIQSIEIDEYDPSYQWTLDIESGILIFTSDAPSLQTHHVYITFTRYIGQNLGSGGGGGGGGLFKAVSDISATELVLNQTREDPKSGDLYFNTTDSRFNYYAEETSAVDKWVPIALARLSGQPPPLLDVSVNATTAYIEVRWRNPKQIATSMTSDLVYTDTNSPASATNWLNQNIIYFPIVNRILLKITSVDAENQPIANDGTEYITYPMYINSGNPIKSQFDSNGYVVFRKGAIISTDDNDDSSRDTFESIPINNLLENMPQGIRIYKSVPTRAERANIYVSNDVVLPFSSTKVDTLLNVDNGGLNRYRFDVWLENNSPDTQILPVSVFSEYIIAPIPEQPRTVQIGLGQNSSNVVSSSLTQCRIQVVDPSFVAGIDDSQDGIVTFTRIKYEWSLDDTTWYSFAKVRANEGPNNATSAIYSGHEYTLDPSGELAINRPVDNTTRFYTFDMTSAFLGTSYTQIDFTKKVHLYVRMSYKNSSNPEFGSPLSRNILFGKPVKPTVQSLKMTRSDQVTVQLKSFTTDDIISVDPSNNQSIVNSPNTNYAIFVKNLEFVFERELDNGNVDVFTMNSITLFGNNTTNSSKSTVQNTNTNYVFTLPVGLPSGTTAASSYKIRVKLRVRNNLLTEYSEFSDVAGTEEDIADASNNALGITDVLDTTNSRITTLVYRKLTFINFLDQLNVVWNQPANFERGIINGKTTDGTNPKIYDYKIQAFRSDVDEETRRMITNTNTRRNRTEDATNLKIVDIRDIVMYNGETTITEKGNGLTPTEKAINILIEQRNEYVGTPTRFDRDFYYQLSKPPPPTANTFSSQILDESNLFNHLIIKWNKPTTQGLETGTTSGSLSDTTIAINRYRVNIIANRSTSGSPYYRSRDLPDDVSLSNIGVFNIAANSNGTINDAVDAQTYILGSNGQVNNNTLYFDSSYNRTNYVGKHTDVLNVLVYPDTSYIVQVYSTNRYYLESEEPLEITHKTTSPPTRINRLTSTSIPNTPLINLNSLNYMYKNQGFFLDRDNPNSTTITTQFFVTNVTKVPSTLTISPKEEHRINTSHFMNFLEPTTYIDTKDTTNPLKLRQFRIVDVAKNPEQVVLSYGDDTTIYPDPEPTTTGDVSGIYTITTTESMDIYTNNPRNQGYWWKEKVGYTFTFTNRTDALYASPIKLRFDVRYNNQLTSPTTYANSSLDTNSDVTIVSKDILFNTANTDDYAYFDKLNTLPSLAKYDGNPYITRGNTVHFAAINGIPNLYSFTMNSDLHTYMYLCNYTLNNYSEYFALDSSVPFTRQKLSQLNIDNIDFQQWGLRENATRKLTSWDISNSEVINTNVGDRGTTSYKNIQIQVIATNTFGTETFTLNESNELNTFVYDKKSAVLISSTLFGLSSAFNAPTNSSAFSSKGQLMEVPSDFTPEIDDSTTQRSDFVETLFQAYGTNFNDKQLLLYDGYFRTPLNFKNNVFDITDSTVKTGYGITDSISMDSGYAFSIFKFTRIRNDTSQGAGAIDIYRFLLSFGENNTITWDDLENGNVVLYIQSGRTSDTTDGTPTDINAYSYVEGANTVRWIRYKPSTKIENTAITSITNSTDITITFVNGLGNSNISSLNKGNFNTSTNITISPYSTTRKNISGLFFGAVGTNKLQITNDGFTFYVAVGIKRNIDRYFDGIHSFDIVDSNGTMLRTLLTK